MKRNAKPSEQLRNITENDTQAVFTNDLQVADILEWILAQSGKADVLMSTFSISEEFLRRLYFLRKKSGKIRALTVLLDRKGTQKTITLWPMIKQVVQDAYLADNHSKVLIVLPIDQTPPVVMVTSQNLTRGNRYESAIISTNKECVEKVKQTYLDIISNHSVPIYDLYTRAAGTNPEDGFNILEDK